MNNYNYYPYNWNRNLINNEEKVNLYSPKEGFEKGNMFENIYSQYKNYKESELRPNSEQEKLLYNIQAICFASHDLNLYLDIHPEDQSMIALLNDYLRKEEELIRDYETKFGPMTLKEDSINKWVNNKWPWEVDNV